MKTLDSIWTNPVKRVPLSKIVMEEIKSAIIKGKLKPGDYLPSETELAASLGVGKSSVREAVKMLEALGVVEIRKGQGSQVRENIDSDVMDPLIFQLILRGSANKESLLEFRLMFETSSTLVAMRNATKQDLDMLYRLCAKMERDFAAGKKDAENDILFHQAILEATHNPFIIHIGNTVLRLFEPSLEISNQMHSDVVLDNHKSILKAFENKDEAAMQRAISDSLKSWGQFSLRDETGC